MAKAPKKRNKKGTVEGFKRREIDAIVNHAYQRIKFLGDAWYKPRACGIQKLWTNLRGPYHDAGLRCFLNHLEREMDWSLNLSCYFRDVEDPEALKVIQGFALFKDITIEDVSANLSDVIIEVINQCIKVDDDYGSKNMIYYTYCLYPEFTESYDIIGDGLSDLMANLTDISNFPTFDDVLPGIPSDTDTLTLALKNNGLWPRIKERRFWPLDETIISDNTDFLMPKETANETM